MEEQQERSEKLIINQGPDVVQGASPSWVNKIFNAFPAFSNRNYRLYFAGQLVSMIGTWLQIVAQGWLILKLTTSPVIIGLMAAISTLPTLLFTLFGGVIVDRFSKKNILLATQIVAMILAFILGIVTILDLITLWMIGILAFLLGMVNSVDAPARQAFVSDLVDRSQLPSAIALNSGVFNAARAIGPGVAGILIATLGTGWAFIVNGLSYIAVIIALLSIHIPLFVPAKRVKAVVAIKEGIFYTAAHPVIRILLIFVGLVSVFGWSYTTLLPLIAKTEYQIGASGLGYFYSATGLGSLLAAFLVAAFSNRIRATYLIIAGNALFSISLILFTLTTDFYLSLFFLFLTGMGLVAQASTINSTLQGMVKSEFRGRIMSLYVLAFIGLVPLGNLQIGFVSEHFGTSFAIRLGAGFLFVFGWILFYYKEKIRVAYQKYKEQEGI